MHVAVAILALGDVAVPCRRRLGVDAVFVCCLLIGVAGGADGLGRRGIVRKCLDVGVTVRASEGAVNGRLELGIVHMEADLLAVLILSKCWVVVTGQTIFVAHLRGLGRGFWRRQCRRREQRSKYHNPTATLHGIPLTFSQPSQSLLVVLAQLLQGLDVLHDCVDLVIAELAFVGRHLSFAVAHQGGQVGVGHLLHLRAAQGLQAHALPHPGARTAVSSMAHRALGFENRRAVRSRKRRARQRQARNQNQRFDFHGLCTFLREIWASPHQLLRPARTSCYSHRQTYNGRPFTFAVPLPEQQ